jgi:hypothetical protein
MGQPVHAVELLVKTGLHFHGHPKPRRLVKEHEETPPAIAVLVMVGGGSASGHPYEHRGGM